MLTRIITDSTHWTGIVLTLILLGSGVVHAKPGDLDLSFGVGGKVSSDHGGHAVSLLLDGKILVAGYTGNYTGINDSATFTLVRYNSDGSLDSSFGSGGKRTTISPRLGFMPGYRESSVAFQPDGKIVLAGHVTPSGSNFLFDSDFKKTLPIKSYWWWQFFDV